MENGLWGHTGQSIVESDITKKVMNPPGFRQRETSSTGAQNDGKQLENTAHALRSSHDESATQKHG